MPTSRPHPGPLFALLRTIFFLAIFQAGVLVYLPWALGVFKTRADYGWHWAGVIVLASGTYILLRCSFAFAWRGQGTPMPFDAPRELVAQGMYRYVRNPMYWGAFFILIGQGILFGRGWGAGWYVALFAGIVHLFVIGYEEPTLRRRFDESYEEYRRNVPRWIPRSTPW